ncbi:DUF4159 domain-containing protein [Flexibacterium corallicola]|uniref:DUF4159 domain-containing protein n=1 Tax=Flexibacterium corallicola TaxID=3037259 RepID=UPI00286F0EE5|nr:DUF4159 domain-containing protein [Pseudovibrio sp. M1P-2-3]
MTGLLSSIAFTNIWVLWALLSLPAIWWLLRLTPPPPQTVLFAPIKLLAAIQHKEETPHHSPWWLILIRLLIASLIIFSLSGPIWKPLSPFGSTEGVRWIVLDNGWDAAPAWEKQIRLAITLINEAGEAGQPVLLVSTADGPTQSMSTDSATKTLEKLRALEPRSWAADRVQLLSGLADVSSTVPPSEIFWLSSLIGEDVNPNAFQEALQDIAPQSKITIFNDPYNLQALNGIVNSSKAMEVSIERLFPDTEDNLNILAQDSKGRVIAQASANFKNGEKLGWASFNLPTELRNDIVQLNISGVQTAGAAFLIDDRWQRQKVGIVSSSSSTRGQPLLSPTHFLKHALEPTSDLPQSRNKDIAQVIPDYLNKGVSTLILADVGRLPTPTKARLEEWIEAGGTLVRFAGPRLAAGSDDLIPVRLRQGDRSLGGSLSWEKPQLLHSFSPEGLFNSLSIPPDISVSRQVLAEPTADLQRQTLASLEDGTPLVTARRMGRGQLILFHVTADTTWSNLPLSGTFVEMLNAIVTSSHNPRPTSQKVLENEDAGSRQLAPFKSLNGFGHLTPPPISARAILEAEFSKTRATRKTPAGLYGTQTAFRALNLLSDGQGLIPLGFLNLEGQVVRPYPSGTPFDLKGPLLVVAFLLAILDSILVLFIIGRPTRPRFLRGMKQKTVLLIALCILSAGLEDAWAQGDLRALDATLDTRLAYIKTGIKSIDDTSRAGLFGLSRMLSSRTALEPKAPVSIDLSKDELAFYPLIYWPVAPHMPTPSQETISRLDAYMSNGGTVLFDTRDQYKSPISGAASTEEKRKLQDILSSLNLPPLEPVPEDHVLTKTFYILNTFPGRYADGPLWVQANTGSQSNGSRPVRSGDGVSPLLITSNDLAAAWAIHPDGSYIYPTIPADPMQREFSYRVGINILMYTMTGNYKADQVHIPALLERLGQ